MSNKLAFMAVMMSLHLSQLTAANDAIVGGTQSNNSYYSALVDSSSGVATNITGAPAPMNQFPQIQTVAIHGDYGITGGYHDRDGAMATFHPYVALVDTSTGVRSAISGIPTSDGQIYSVAINSSGNGIIGGTQNGYPNGDPFVALFDSSGSTTALSGGNLPSATNGRILSVAINASGDGIIGGIDNTNQPYVSLVASGGSTSALSGDLPIGANARINSVAINASGDGIIGGFEPGSLPYAARVSGGVASALTGAAPSGNGSIVSVAINNSGAAVIGGTEGGDPYAAMVQPDGTRISLSGPATPQAGGEIYSVAINSSGVAIIGGMILVIAICMQHWLLQMEQQLL